MKHTKTILSLTIFLPFAFVSCNINDSLERNLITINSAQIYLINTVTDSLYQIADGEQPFFIPNSDKILYRSSDSLFTINYDGTNKKFLSNAYGGSIFLHMGITVSDDGRYVLYSGQDHSPGDLYLVSINSGLSVNLTHSPDRSEGNPHFYKNNNRIIYSEIVFKDKIGGDYSRLGISSIDLSGYSYEKISPDSCGCIYVGSTMNDNYFVTESGYADKDSSIIIITLIDERDNSIKDTINFINQSFSSAPTVDNNGYLYYCVNNSNIYKMNLFTRETTKLYTGLINDHCSYSSDFKKTLFVSGTKLIMLDLQTGQTKTYFNDMGADFALWNFSYSKDNKYIAVEKTKSKQVYNY